MAFNSKFTGAEVEALLDKVDEGGVGGYGYWNYYFFEGGSAESVVTIDGKEVSVPANTIVEGNFTDDITAIGTNNLKRIITRGDVSLSICNSSSSQNTTLEEVDMEFSKGFARSFDYAFYNLRGLKRLRVAGGQVTSAFYACQYVGASTEAGCEVDVKGMDFSQMTLTNGCYYLFRNAKLASVDISGHTFNRNAYDMFLDATVGSVDMSGCTFSGDTSDMFLDATVGSVDMSGCTFSGDAYDMFVSATVGSVDMSGCTFSGDTYDMFYDATVGSVDMSGCTFSGDTYDMFLDATVGSVDMSGCDLSKCTNTDTFFINGTILAININGLIDKENDDQLIQSLGQMNEASVITGQTFSEIAGGSYDFSDIEFKRGSIMCLLNSLSDDGGSIALSSFTMERLTSSDIEVATQLGWSLTA